jgi:hypothetical protein
MHGSEMSGEECPIAPSQRRLVYAGFALAVLNLILGMSHQLLVLCRTLGIHRVAGGTVVSTGLYVLFVLYWAFWFIPFFPSVAINLYGWRHKQRLSAIGIGLSILGLLALLVSYLSFGGQLPD